MTAFTNPNAKIIYIHIGTQKTGSTTIQKTLSKYSNELLEEGLVYLGKCRKIASGYNIAKSTNLNSEIVDELTKYLDKSFKKIKYQDKSRYIISNEKFSGNKFTGYNNAKILAETLKAVTNNLEVDAKIIVFIRRQDKYLESTYKERIFKGESYTFDDFLNRYKKAEFHWDTFLDTFAEKFGHNNIKVKRYGNEFLPKKHSLINNFGNSVESEFLKNFNQTLFKNRSYSKDILEIARISNAVLTNNEIKKIREILKKVNSQYPQEEYSLFSNKQRSDYMKRYQKSNSRVAKKYFNIKTGRLFAPIQESPDIFHKNEPLSLESVVPVLLKSILLLQNDMEYQYQLTRKKSTVEKIVKKIKSYLN
jgi:hypothetical protein